MKSFFYKISECFVLFLQGEYECIQRENVYNLNRRRVRSAHIYIYILFNYKARDNTNKKSQFTM